MKTSIDLPDNLYRQVKAKSALEGKTVREVATALFAAYATGGEPTSETASEAKRDAPEPTDRGARLRRLLEREVWPTIPADLPPLTKADEDAILGFGETGA